MRDLSRYVKDYALEPSGSYHFETYQLKYRKKKILERLALYPHRRILEIGCAMDPLYRHITDCEQFVIVEPADAFYHAALEGAKDRGDVECVHGLLEESLPKLKKHDYDFIILCGLLHEVECPERMMSAVHELCGPNTVVHINVPNAFSFHRLLAVEMGLIDSVHQKSETQIRMQQHRIFDPDSLSALITAAGFKVLDQGTCFIKPFTHSQMSQLMEAGFATEQMLDGFYGMERHMPRLGSEMFVDVQKSSGAEG